MNTFNGKVNIDYLNEAAKVLAPIKQKSYEKMQLVKGDCVLDVGCGPGIDVIALRQVVSSTGYVIGVDHDKNMLNQAKNQVKTLGKSDSIKFEQCSASELPFTDNYFSSCRSERLFVHLSNPGEVLTEMHRVTKPGGRVVVVDADWGSLSIDCKATKTEQLLKTYRCEKFLTNAYSGRSLYRLFRLCNFDSIEIEVVPMYFNNLELSYALSVQEAVENQALAENIISQQALTEWRNELQLAEKNQTYYSSVNIVLVSGIT